MPTTDAPPQEPEAQELNQTTQSPTARGCATGFLTVVGAGLIVVDGLWVMLVRSWPSPRASLSDIINITSPGLLGIALIYFGVKLQDPQTKEQDQNAAESARKRSWGWALIVFGIPIAILAYRSDLSVIMLIGTFMALSGIALLIPTNDKKAATEQPRKS